MGAILSRLYSTILTITTPIRRPIYTFQLLIESITWIPSTIFSDESVQLAIQDTSRIINSFLPTLRYWLLPTLIVGGIYAIKYPPPAQINEVLGYYKHNGINTLRPYEYKYPVGVFAEHLRVR